MSSAIITVENLGKKYRLHHQQPERYTTLRDTIARKAGGLFKKLKIGKADMLKDGNQIPGPHDSSVSTSQHLTISSDEDFWALQGVSFEVRQGEVVGIIGRNGAGKSTLLKILSRITEPTTGKVHLRGRVASLLEVGTGFHPELTGRENIFLNGAILGMNKMEIKAKFNEIVAFAEVEKFLDTPVKHYSSGMYVRLAFAVAAHLEPEILIVDEVLAVGDAQFQEKCLGKMNEVATKTGRIVLFVSHNMAAITTLTRRCLVLKSGKIIADTDTANATAIYLASIRTSEEPFYRAAPTQRPTIISCRTSAAESSGVHVSGALFTAAIDINFPGPIQHPCLSFQIVNGQSIPVTHFWSYDKPSFVRTYLGITRYAFVIPRLALNAGHYTISIYLSEPPGGEVFEVLHNVCPFTVEIHGRTTLFGWRPSACTYLEDFDCSTSSIQ